MIFRPEARLDRRKFMTGVAGAALITGTSLPKIAFAQEKAAAGPPMRGGLARPPDRKGDLR